MEGYDDEPASLATSPASSFSLGALPLSEGDFDRGRSVVGFDFEVGGDDATDGGEAGSAGSPEASRLASALRSVQLVVVPEGEKVASYPIMLT